MAEFLSSSSKLFADQIEEVDLLQFCDGLRKRGLSERTVMNYYSSIATFLRSCGIDHKNLVAKEHRPHKEDPDPEVYTEDEICKFLAACNCQRDRLFFEFLLKTGAREKEATHAEWTDINWTENAITIHGEIFPCSRSITSDVASDCDRRSLFSNSPRRDVGRVEAGTPDT